MQKRQQMVNEECLVRAYLAEDRSGYTCSQARSKRQSEFGCRSHILGPLFPHRSESDLMAPFVYLVRTVKRWALPPNA